MLVANQQAIVSGAAVIGVKVLSKYVLLALVNLRAGPWAVCCIGGTVALGVKTTPLTRSTRLPSLMGSHNCKPLANGLSRFSLKSFGLLDFIVGAK